MHRIFRVKAYEAEHGPHFNEEHARKAVSKMENEDGTRGPHWSVEETTALASQYGINLGSRFNRYDWFVALNMVYSDYYKVIISMTNSNSTKHSGVSQISCDTKLSSCEVINAITSGNATLASELANCCCTTQRSIDAVNNNITKMGYENQLSVCNQTNNLVNTMNSNTLALRDSGTANTQSIIAKLDAMQNQALLDKIDSLRERNSTLLTQLSQEIINIVRNQYNTYKQRKESIAKCDEEMAKCQALLDKLGINDKPAKENDEIIALQKEVNELKNIIRKANQMVPPPMKEMLPQDMKNAMDKVGQ